MDQKRLTIVPESISGYNFHHLRAHATCICKSEPRSHFKWFGPRPGRQEKLKIITKFSWTIMVSDIKYKFWILISLGKMAKFITKWHDDLHKMVLISAALINKIAFICFTSRRLNSSLAFTGFLLFIDLVSSTLQNAAWVFAFDRKNSLAGHKRSTKGSPVQCWIMSTNFWCSMQESFSSMQLSLESTMELSYRHLSWEFSITCVNLTLIVLKEKWSSSKHMKMWRPWKYSTKMTRTSSRWLTITRAFFFLFVLNDFWSFDSQIWNFSL